MTPDEMVAHLASMAGNYGTLIDTFALQELKNAQLELEGRATLPFQLIEERYTTTTTNEPRVVVPQNFLKEVEESALWYVNDDSVFRPLVKGHQDANRADWTEIGYTDEDTDGPRAYSILGGYFYIYPTPSAVYRLQMTYYAQDSVLAAAGAANLWSTNYPDLLMGIAGRNILTHSGQIFDTQNVMALMNRFEQMAQDGMRRLIASNTAREVANMELSYGGG